MAGDYVTVAELSALMGLTGADATRAGQVCEAACQIVDDYIGPPGVDTYLQGPVWPAAIAEAALTIACDLWRRPSLPGGYQPILNGDVVARVALDPAKPVSGLLDPYRLSWGIA